MITVIVPVYNTEKYLQRCLKSIDNQSFRDIEIIVIDDGSTDNSGRIADYFALLHEKVIIYHIPNQGVSKARNIGMDSAKGEWIAFVDSDDTIRPDMYEKLIQAGEDNNVDVVASDLVIKGQQIKSNKVLPNQVIEREEIVLNILPQFSQSNAIGTMEFKTKIFRSSVIRNNSIRFYEGFLFQEDLMFMINIYGNAQSLYYLQNGFYEYAPLSTGLYSSYRKDGGEKFIEARKIILGLIEQYKIPNIDWSNFNNSFLYNICFFIYRTENYVKDIEEQRNLIKSVLRDAEVITACTDLQNTATSFERRIAKMIAHRHEHLALLLIRFVYSGKAEKTQRLLTRIREIRK